MFRAKKVVMVWKGGRDVLQGACLAAENKCCAKFLANTAIQQFFLCEGV